MTNGRLQEIKNKRKLQTVISISGRGRLQEVVALTEKNLIFWKHGRSREVVAYERWSQGEV